VICLEVLVFFLVKNGENFLGFQHTTPLIVPDQKATIDTVFCGGCFFWNRGVPTDTPTLKSVLSF